ncbi:hypothetical protein EJ05DRAFT_373148 [Pseudovirgaria hyperparasitica]|uniref:Uncharacterized protein n=1 Tax=Pseudovirgaria hyperparasitica TaxID=470096 RepID=A0A6A6W4W0_9PEZI|nr:uncharacterized protein EJ05DRAFT_373148 [Pseudovirgaria hyperparasitica]KAF2757968.1 hypothetical protein EJ05DRAFT_373148 [Pseudovirgaria hyperparasitica]
MWRQASSHSGPSACRQVAMPPRLPVTLLPTPQRLNAGAKQHLETPPSSYAIDRLIELITLIQRTARCGAPVLPIPASSSSPMRPNITAATFPHHRSAAPHKRTDVGPLLQLSTVHLLLYTNIYACRVHLAVLYCSVSQGTPDGVDSIFCCKNPPITLSSSSSRAKPPFSGSPTTHMAPFSADSP